MVTIIIITIIINIIIPLLVYTCNQGIRNHCIIAVMRNLPARTTALETGVFGQTVAVNYFKGESRKDNGGTFYIYVVSQMSFQVKYPACHNARSALWMAR